MKYDHILFKETQIQVNEYQIYISEDKKHCSPSTFFIWFTTFLM